MSSNIPNKAPKAQSPKGILQMRVKRICPALMLANNRKHKVTGRTKILISSTIDKNGIKYQGELEGSTAAAFKLLIFWIKTPLSQNEKAKLKLKLRLVVTGKL